MTNELRPITLGMKDDNTLEIKWSDNADLLYTIADLRAACPCATCREKRDAAPSNSPELLPVLSIAETAPLKIQSMNPVGSYAYAIAFSDGHDTGIFTLEHLRSIGQIPT